MSLSKSESGFCNPVAHDANLDDPDELFYQQYFLYASETTETSLLDLSFVLLLLVADCDLAQSVFFRPLPACLQTRVSVGFSQTNSGFFLSVHPRTIRAYATILDPNRTRRSSLPFHWILLQADSGQRMAILD